MGWKRVSKKQCSRKILEVVLPDTFITENTLKVLSDFKTQWADKGIEVIYKLAK